MRRLLLLLSVCLPLSYAQTLEIAVDQAPVGLDPHVVTAFSSFAVIGQIYDGLLEVNADLSLEPALATDWTISEDGLTYTFNLREGVTFHDGSSFTAEDVVYSFNRIMAEDTGSPQASRFAQVASVEAVDGSTVVFTLSEPFAPFLSNLPNLNIVPQEVVEAEGDLQQVAVGTGPFMLEEVVPDTYVLLTANPNYYREGLPMLEALRYNIVPEASTRAAGLRTGTYHLLPDVDPATAMTLQNVPSVNLLGTQDLAYSLLGVNTEREPFNDPRVRRAINLAINREEIVDAVYFGNAAVGGVLSPGLPTWEVDVNAFDCYRHDPQAAQALLEEAGVSNLEMELLSFGTIRVVSDLAQVLQAQLADAGIEAEVNIEEFGNFVQRWRNSDFDAFVSLNGGSTDPDGYLHRTFISSGSTNVFQYSDEEVDSLLEAGRTTTNVSEREAIYSDLQNRLACEGPVMHIAYATLFTGLRDNVNGFVQMPTRSLRYLREVTLE